MTDAAAKSWILQMTRLPTKESDVEANRLRRRMIGGATLVVGAAMALSTPTASAAHCTDRGEPGNSDFSVHVRESNGPGDHNEGDHQGWSSCEAQAHSGGR